MAKKAKRLPKKKSKAKKSGDEEIEHLSLRLQLEPSDDTPTFYINYAEVTSTKNEYALLGVRVPAKFSASKIEQIKSNNGMLVLEPDCQIIIPVTIVQGLMDALQTQKEIYNNFYGSLSGDQETGGIKDAKK